MSTDKGARAPARKGPGRAAAKPEPAREARRAIQLEPTAPKAWRRPCLINFINYFTGQELPLVWGDPTRLKQVVLNLVSNAVKFTEKGKVSLSAEAAGGEITVAVSDTGMGIPTDEQEAIFDAD